jgi:hypothetical protein
VATGLNWGGIGQVEIGPDKEILVSGGASSISRVARLGRQGDVTWDRAVGSNPISDLELQGTKMLLIGPPDWTVRRLKANGTVDSSFGGGDGSVTTSFEGMPGTPLDGEIMAKRLVVVGGAIRPTTGGAVAVYVLGA